MNWITVKYVVNWQNRKLLSGFLYAIFGHIPEGMRLISHDRQRFLGLMRSMMVLQSNGSCVKVCCEQYGKKHKPAQPTCYVHCLTIVVEYYSGSQTLTISDPSQSSPLTVTGLTKGQAKRYLYEHIRATAMTHLS